MQYRNLNSPMKIDNIRITSIGVLSNNLNEQSLQIKTSCKIQNDRRQRHAHVVANVHSDQKSEKYIYICICMDKRDAKISRE